MTNNEQTSGHADYLMGEQEKAQAAATTPTVQPTANAGGDSYAAFLRTLENNKKIENTPTGAKTYADFLVYMGQDPVGDYLAKRRQADVDYAKAMATYGMTAEKMAKSGLAASGYGEYLQGVAYQQRQSAVTDAQKTAAAEQKSSFVSYADYLDNFSAKQKAEEQALAEQQRTEIAGATSAVSELMSAEGGGMTIDAALASLNGVYSQEVLDKVKENVSKSSITNLEAAVTGTNAPMQDFFVAIDQMQTNGFITDQAQYDGLVTKARTANYNAIMRAFSTRDPSGIADYANAAGIDLSMGGEDALNAVVEYAVARGHIEGKDRQRYYFSTWANAIEKKEYSPTNAKNEVANIYNLYDEGKVTKEQRDNLMGVLGKAVEDSTGFEFDDIDWRNGVSATLHYTYTNDKGKTKKGAIDLHMETGFDHSKLVVEGDFKLLWSGEDGAQIGRVGDQLVFVYNGTYRKMRYKNGSENDIAVAWMLTHGE